MDWADEKAKSLLNPKSWDWPDDTGEGREEILQDWRDTVAQALRDVQRETAEECACICEAQANRDDDCEFSTTVCHNMDAAKIREYLPKEKP